MEKLNTYNVVCEGGLNSNQNYIQLSQFNPGMATALLNYEASLFGGYRKINGFEALNTTYPEVDATNAEGRVLGLAVLGTDIIAARKQQGSDTYSFYLYQDGLDWLANTSSITLNSLNVTKIRHTNYNFNGTNKISFVDGRNFLTNFDGTSWSQIDPSDTGQDQALTAPKYISLFRNHIFVAGDETYPHIVAHSAPTNEGDWGTANGAGQINAGFVVKQIYPFRDELYVFGEKQIKKIVVDGTSFVIQDVTLNIGCIAPDSVTEIDADLIFLAQDGLRTIGGTARIGDVNIAALSKNIQQDIKDLIQSGNLNDVDSLVVKSKSQYRLFFNSEFLPTTNTPGIIGCIRNSVNGLQWEWGRLLGIRTSCTLSEYIGTQEYILHGDFNGKVYRQEMGSAFDTAPILAVYTTPYIDFGDVYVRKTLHKISLFIRPEGELTLSMALQFDWSSREVLNPMNYLMELNVEGTIYGVGIYGVNSYSSPLIPATFSYVEGSSFSNRLTLVTNDTKPSYSIQAIVYEYAVNGRK